jgi:hypothetical protein
MDISTYMLINNISPAIRPNIMWIFPKGFEIKGRIHRKGIILRPAKWGKRLEIMENHDGDSFC